MSDSTLSLCTTNELVEMMEKWVPKKSKPIDRDDKTTRDDPEMESMDDRSPSIGK